MNKHNVKFEKFFSKQILTAPKLFDSYPWVLNLSSKIFKRDELQLLNYDLNFSIGTSKVCMPELRAR